MIWPSAGNGTGDVVTDGRADSPAHPFRSSPEIAACEPQTARTAPTSSTTGHLILLHTLTTD
ncbi:hypothetical protein PWY87_33530 [Kribbella solani]|uniref:hypothetical protein n=1 Tax=Kribbella solani TaxID=236067 RepID=UPI0029B043A4|nr:hypothetical protein [Kribbella solani]MDX2968643.1 hypothetical protein [Kribbella solani]MDX3006645.1 hypothetical protein [Kribbella solani]